MTTPIDNNPLSGSGSFNATGVSSTPFSSGEIITGIGPVKKIILDYTSPGVANRYQELMAELLAIFNKTGKTPGDPNTLTPDDYKKVLDVIAQFQDLGQNGLVGSVNPKDPSAPQRIFYMSGAMIDQLDQLMKSLEATGIKFPEALNVTDPLQQIQALQAWQSLSSFGIQELLTKGVATVVLSATRSLQSLVELEYVKLGNQIIFENLTSLEQALRNTQGILDTLNNVQSSKNLIGASLGFKDPTNPNSPVYKSFNSFLWGHFPNFGSLSVDGQRAAYQTAGSIFFTQINPNAQGTVTDAKNLLISKGKLYQQIAALESASPSNNRNVKGTLAFELFQVAKNISAIMVDDNGVPLSLGSDPNQMTKHLNLWIIDNGSAKGSLTQSGDIQTNITNAVTAAQSLSDQQQQAVNRYLFIFQEFYTSASNILQTLTQLIRKFAQGAAG